MKPWGLASVVVLCCACSKSAEHSVAQAREHARALTAVAESDVKELRSGLPEGAALLAKAYSATNLDDDAQEARRALAKTRSAVQDLRVAKSTFFALAKADGTVIRTDQEQDLMVGKALFAAFPELAKAAAGAHVETKGSLKEAAGVAKRADAQWVSAEPIRVDGKVRALYVTGWSWSAYAYRLENSLRGTVQSSLGGSAKMPLLYVYMVVDSAVYGAPVSPEVNARAIADQAPLSKLGADGGFATKLEITDREFGLAVQRAPALGDRVAIAVLRSET